MKHVVSRLCIAVGLLSAPRSPVRAQMTVVTSPTSRATANVTVSVPIDYSPPTGQVLPASGFSRTFSVHANGIVFLHVAASATRNGPGMMTLHVEVDGTDVGAVKLYESNSGIHLALVPQVIVLDKLSPSQPHTIRIDPEPQTIVDENDFVKVTVVEYYP
jgi:hypothetical protein